MERNYTHLKWTFTCSAPCKLWSHAILCISGLLASEAKRPWKARPTHPPSPARMFMFLQNILLGRKRYEHLVLWVNKLGGGGGEGRKISCILRFRLCCCACRRWTGSGVNRLYQSRTTEPPHPHTGLALGPPHRTGPGPRFQCDFWERGQSGDRAGLLVWNGTLVLGAWRRSLEASSSSWAPTGARWCSWGSWRRWKAPPGRFRSRPVRGQSGVRPVGCAGLDPLSRKQTLRGEKSSKVAPLGKEKKSSIPKFVPSRRTQSSKSQSDDGFSSHSRVEQPS